MSSGHQRIKRHRNIAENFNRLSRVHERYRQTDDRQTDDRQTDDRQTDGRRHEHEHEFTFAKNAIAISSTRSED